MNGEATIKCSPAQIAGVWIGLQIAILLSALDQTVLNIVIPKISAALQAFDKSAWIITSYLLFSTIATPISGKLADIFGVKKVLLGATVLFGLTSALCGVSGLCPSILHLDAIDQLILSRALQGTAGGAMLGLCFVSVGEVFALGERGKYQGFLAAAFIAAALVGPTLGGYIADAFSWRLVFFINIPMALIAVLFFAFCFPPSSRARAQTIIDYPGIILFISTLIPIILGASDIGHQGHISTIAALLVAGAGLSLLAFLWREKHAPEPLIPLKIFADRLIAISLITVFVTGIALFGSMLLLAVILQEILGQTATASGLTLTPLMIVVAGASILSGLILAKTGKYKILCLVAIGLLATGTFMLSRLTQTASIVQMLTAAAIGGTGLGFLLPVHTIIIQKVVPGEIMGVATSMTQFFRSLGGTIGTGMMSAIMLCLSRQVSLPQTISQVLELYAILLILVLLLNFFLPEVPLKQARPAPLKDPVP